MACIELIIGSMYSGKTSELIRRARRYQSINKNVLMINHSLDIRCSNEVKSHTKSTFPAIKTKQLLNVDISSDCDVVCIDEAQFFTDLLEFVHKVENSDIVLIICGLDGDFQRNAFGQILNIIPFADSVVKLTALCALCRNKNEAAFTKKINGNNKQIDIGAHDKYLPVCRSCFLQPLE